MQGYKCSTCVVPIGTSVFSIPTLLSTTQAPSSSILRADCRARATGSLCAKLLRGGLAGVTPCAAISRLTSAGKTMALNRAVREETSKLVCCSTQLGSKLDKGSSLNVSRRTSQGRTPKFPRLPSPPRPSTQRPIGFETKVRNSGSTLSYSLK